LCGTARWSRMLFFRDVNHESSPFWDPDGGEAFDLLSLTGICSLVFVGACLWSPSSSFPPVEAADERLHRMVVRVDLAGWMGQSENAQSPIHAAFFGECTGLPHMLSFSRQLLPRAAPSTARPNHLTPRKHSKSAHPTLASEFSKQKRLFSAQTSWRELYTPK
jgi:hypothetical protein